MNFESLPPWTGLLLSSLRIGVLVVSENGRVELVNDRLVALISQPKENLIGRNFWEILPFYREKIFFERDNLPVALSSDSVSLLNGRYEFVLPTKALQVETQAFFVAETKETLVLISDLTAERIEREKLLIRTNELIQAKDRLERQAAQGEAIIRGIANGLVVTDPHNRILIMNPAAQSLLGWDLEEVIGQLADKFLVIESDFAGQPKGDEARSVLSTITARKKISTDYYLRRKDGSRFPVEMTSSAVLSGEEVLGTVIVFVDITEQKEIERAKSDFVAIASHQLRTPLGSMRWNLEMILGGDYGQVSEPVKEVLQLVLESNNRLAALVTDLLSVSRIDQGRLVEEPEPVIIVPVISDVVRELTGAADKRAVTLVTNFPSADSPVITVAPKRFREAIENLLSNAIKYNRPSGVVTVKVANGEKSVLISVADQGIGIPESSKERMFSKFFRADNAIKSDTEGSGLGLFVVKSYVEGWGGKIWFESQEGQGTTFFVEIPLKPPTHPTTNHG